MPLYPFEEKAGKIFGRKSELTYICRFPYAGLVLYREGSASESRNHQLNKALRKMGLTWEKCKRSMSFIGGHRYRYGRTFAAYKRPTFQQSRKRICWLYGAKNLIVGAFPREPVVFTGKECRICTSCIKNRKLLNDTERYYCPILCVLDLAQALGYIGTRNIY